MMSSFLALYHPMLDLPDRTLSYQVKGLLRLARVDALDHTPAASTVVRADSRVCPVLELTEARILLNCHSRRYPSTVVKDRTPEPADLVV